MFKYLCLITCLITFNTIHLHSVPGFDAQARGGIAGRGDWEIGLQGDGAPLVNAGWDWVSGEIVPFNLTYSVGTQEMVWTFGPAGPSQVVLTRTIANNLTGTVRVWAKTASTQVKPGDSVSITDIVLSATIVENGGDLLATGPDDFDEHTFSQFVTGDFTVTGNASLTWTGSLPTRSRMQFHIPL